MNGDYVVIDGTGRMFEARFPYRAYPRAIPNPDDSVTIVQSHCNATTFLSQFLRKRGADPANDSLRAPVRRVLMTDVTPRKRPLVRWPFIVLALIPSVGTLALYLWLGEPSLARRGARPLLSQHVEAWAITIGIASVMLATPARTYRWAILLLLIAAILAALIV